MPRPRPEAGTWEDLNRRVTFYCPLDLLEEIECEMEATGRSKTQVIIDALRRDLLGGGAEALAQRRQLRAPLPAHNDAGPG